MYSAAGGKKIANEGEKDITMVTGTNEIVQTNWQTVDITRPLSSVRQICLQGNRVLFGAQGGVIYNIESATEPHAVGRDESLVRRGLAFEESCKPFRSADIRRF